MFFSYFCNMDSKLYTTMKQRIILFGLILVGTVTFAQSPVEKGLNTINRSSAEATIGFLASDELQT